MDDRPLALVDIDGVLANDTARVPFALNKDWAEYFDPTRMYADAVWPEGRMLVNFLAHDGWQIAYLTGRREDRREVTALWLKNNGFPFGVIYMRPTGIRLRLAELKALRFAGFRQEDPDRRITLWDDDPEVVNTVQAQFGMDAAVHCTWYIKPTAMVRRATA